MTLSAADAASTVTLHSLSACKCTIKCRIPCNIPFACVKPSRGRISDSAAVIARASVRGSIVVFVCFNQISTTERFIQETRISSVSSRFLTATVIRSPLVSSTIQLDVQLRGYVLLSSTLAFCSELAMMIAFF